MNIETDQEIMEDGIILPPEEKEISSVLFLVDTQNIYYSAKSLYGNLARIDFRKLKEKAVAGRSLQYIKSVAFLADFKMNDTIFTGILTKFGYEIVGFNKNASSDISDYVDNEGQDFDLIVIGSGSGDLLSLYKNCDEKNYDIKVMAFPDSLHADVAGSYGTIILDADVLLRTDKNDK